MVLLHDTSPPDFSDSKPVYARSGWLIPQEQIPALPIELLRIRGRELQEWVPNLTLRSVSPYPYNCMGMVFASRRAWIEIDEIENILREDGYRPIHSSNKVTIGDIVLYRYDGEPSHVAVVFSVELVGTTPNIKVISKWGKDPEFIHFVNMVHPNLGEPTEYWTDRIT